MAVWLEAVQDDQLRGLIYAFDAGFISRAFRPIKCAQKLFG